MNRAVPQRNSLPSVSEHANCAASPGGYPSSLTSIAGDAAWRLTARAVNSIRRGIAMRKFSLFAVTALILTIDFGALNASTTEQVAAPSDRIDVLGMMTRNLPTEQFVDYSL